MIKMTILVTGGAGFIGSHTVDKLLERGEEIIIIDNFDNYYKPKQKEENIKNALKNKNCKLYKINITNFKKLEKVFQEKKINKIIHLAAKVGVRPSLQIPETYSKVNIEGTINLLELARIYNIKTFIFGSSSSVYGNRKKVPFCENDFTDNPISPYAATKKSGELFCYTYHKLYDLNITCLRFFTVYGPRNRPDMAIYKFSDLIYNEKELPIFGNGRSKRDYTYVTDIVDGIVSALDKEYPFEIFNLGNSKPINLDNLIKIIEKEVGKKAKLKFIDKQAGDVEITYANISKSQDMLSYDPKVKIEKGIDKFFEWYKKIKSKTF